MSTREDGSVTLWLLGMSIMLIALGGISVDLWRSFSARRALAGASAIDEQRYRDSGIVVLLPSVAERRARDSLATQLDQAALLGADVAATEQSVTVVVHGRVGFSLLGILSQGSFELEVAATAAPRRSP